MLIGQSMDVVSLPKVPGCHTTFAKIRSIHAEDSISVFIGPKMHFFGKWTWLQLFSELKKMAENMQLKFNERVDTNELL
jgi:hypothetical protein